MKHWYFITILSFIISQHTLATVYDVNSLDVTNTGNGNSGTLLYCINQANSTAGPHTINFSVAGTISITDNSVLPDLSQAITIDATTAPGYNGSPVVILDGSNSTYGDGLTISAAHCGIFGLQISDFPYNGLIVSGNASDYFQIGAAGKGNVIINNGYRGLQIDKADNGMIAYNKIGVEASGISCAGNGYDGIDMLNSANNDSIYFNHVSCNEYNGIQIGGCDGTVIKGNIIGPLATSCSGNLYRGIDIEDGADNTIVGGTDPSESNKIAGNYYWGIEVKNNSINNLLSGNSYLCNDYGAIEINNGGNNNMATPVISSANASTVSGTSSANAIIEVFKSQNTNFNQCTNTPSNQGADYLGTTTADTNGDWSLSGTFGGYVTATAHDADGNTSIFSSTVYTGTSDTLINKCEGSILNVLAGFVPSAFGICEKQCLDFTDQSQDAIAWHWYFPGGIPDESMDQNPSTICYNVSGTYEVTQIVYSASGDSATATASITIYSTPPIPEVTLQNDTLISTPALTYQWYFDGAIIPGATDQHYVVTENGFYYVEVTDSNGCFSNSIAITVILEGIRPVAAMEWVNIQSSPDENSFELSIQLFSAESFLLSVFDATGKEIHRENFLAYAGHSGRKIYLSNVSPGIYLVKLESQNVYKSSAVLIR